jgi:hypothetical protein
MSTIPAVTPPTPSRMEALRKENARRAWLFIAIGFVLLMVCVFVVARSLPVLYNHLACDAGSQRACARLPSAAPDGGVAR